MKLLFYLERKRQTDRKKEILILQREIKTKNRQRNDNQIYGKLYIEWERQTDRQKERQQMKIQTIDRQMNENQTEEK